MAKSGSAPQAPDPNKLINTQTAANKDQFNFQTDANRYDVNNPYGSTTWGKTSNFDEDAYNKALQSWQTANPQGHWVEGTPAGSTVYDPSYSGGDSGPAGGLTTPGTGGHWEGGQSGGTQGPTKDQFTTYKYTQNQNLSPEQQKIFDAQQAGNLSQAQITQQLASALGGSLGQPVDFSGMPALATGAGLDPEQFSQRASDAAYSAATRYLDPQVKQQQQQLEARLSEQGFTPGTPGYAQAMQGFQDANARAYGAARDSSIGQGYSVGHTQFGDELSSRGFENTARNQAIAEYLKQRETPLNEYNQLKSGQQGFDLSQLLGSGAGSGAAATLGGVDTMDAFNNQYKGLLDNYNADVSSANSTNSTLASLGTALAMFLS